MRKKGKKIIVLTVGIIFIISGLFGLVLPFFQGIFSLVIGIILISICIPKVRVFIKKHTDKHPHLSPILNELEARLLKFIGEM